MDSGNLFEFCLLHITYYILMNREYRTEMIELPTIASNMIQMTNLLNLLNFEEVEPVFFINIIPTFCFFTWHSLQQ